MTDKEIIKELQKMYKKADLIPNSAPIETDYYSPPNSIKISIIKITNTLREREKEILKNKLKRQ